MIMNNNIKNTLRMGIIAAAGAAAMISCSDTWDDHYDAASVRSFDGTTMKAIETNAPAFAEVIKAVGYNRELSSDNVYTIWAPVSFNKDSLLTLARTDSAAVVDKFIKNHIARYTVSQNGTNQEVALMSSKNTMMTSDGMFGSAKIKIPNLSCSNGVLHVIDANINYQNNIFEQIEALYNPASDSISLYSFLEIWNADSLDESRSVSRGKDDNGYDIWVDSVTIRNNTVLKNVDALVYEEDSSYIAIIPSAKAYDERYNIAKKLLVFNPHEDAISTGACDSLQKYYANMFAMTDLFFNKNANEHWQDSLKSTNYEMSFDWPNHIYYSKVPRNGLHPDKQVNDILAKCGTPIYCSNGDAYAVDEYPMSAIEQFFKKRTITATSRSIDNSTSSKDNTPLYTKNVGSTTMMSGTIYDYATDTIWNEDQTEIVKVDSTYIGTRNFRFLDVVPTSSSTNPSIAFQIPNTLSGTYDLYLVTCPIWAKTGFNNGEKPENDPRGYRFYTYIWERGENGEYPSSGVRLVPPEEGAELSEGNYYQTGYTNKIDTLYLGEYTFSNAYYGRNEEGVLIQFQTQVSSKLASTYSREMLITSIILRPKLEATDETAATEAKRK